MKAFLLLTLMPLTAFADGLVVPDGDALQLLFNLIANWKTTPVLVAGSTLIVVIVGVLKKTVGDFNYKRVLIALLSVVYSVFQSLTAGLGIWEAIVLALVTYGGAFAIYEGLVNPALKKNV